ncbi:hypothetical protein JDV02_009637 [Purpureocillium takamizusanense]|uniref:1-alkyl-2-acetylglycerophosphocholine esterase n=1 Tax=Purpureocillium takamizusanense TaxID=2060973 RepID=A0A9Q8QQD8_9HYPO|nr:uncharacterized protein JDV02_009637 [Purpureocillium takamizusanense]UNI23843.1 hypothetical protein JDV02_009637 [Purpureocillium takamizusanense]
MLSLHRLDHHHHHLSSSPAMHLVVSLTCLLSAAAQAVLVPGPPGPYGVASRVLAFTDDARPDPYEPTQKRRILVSAFLPVDKSTHACRLDAAALMPPLTTSVYNQQAVEGGLPNDTFSRFEMQYCRLPAPPLNNNKSENGNGGGCRGNSSSSKYPVVLFSPGYGVSRLAYSAGARALASHGKVVITIDHPHDAILVEFPDGAVFYGDVNQTDPNATRKSLPIRVADISFLVDQLHRPSVIDALTKDYPGRLDVDKLILYGHSLGGNTAANAMLRDGRILAGANIDGHMYGPVIERGLAAPFLLVGTPGHSATPGSNWPELYGRLRGAKMDLAVARTQHLAFTDVPLLVTRMPDIAPENRPLLDKFIGDIDGALLQDVVLEVVNGLVELGVAGRSEKLRGIGERFKGVVTVLKSRLPGR